jgi:hypothetical protein
VVALAVLAAASLGVSQAWNALDHRHPVSSVASAVAAAVYPVHVGDKWGYIDPAGRMVIAPQYADAGDFSEGLAPVAQISPDTVSQTTGGNQTAGAARELWGFIDQSGKMVIQPKFSEARAFSDGRAWVSTDEFHGFIDAHGKLVIALGKDETARDFSQGLVRVEQDGKWGYVDTAGGWVVKPVYVQAYSFSEGLAAVQMETGNGLLHGYIDPTGRLVWQYSSSGAGGVGPG